MGSSASHRTTFLLVVPLPLWASGKQNSLMPPDPHPSSRYLHLQSTGSWCHQIGCPNPKAQDCSNQSRMPAESTVGAMLQPIICLVYLNWPDLSGLLLFPGFRLWGQALWILAFVLPPDLDKLSVSHLSTEGRLSLTLLLHGDERL